MYTNDVLQIAIIGSGKIGTDLLIKAQRSPLLNCALFVGRNYNSPGLRKALEMGVMTSDQSIQAVIADAEAIDVVFDATSAQDHLRHAPVFEHLGIKAIDLTPAEVGPFSVPCLEGPSLMEVNNLNMVTCGGQASVPIANVLTQAFPELHQLEVTSYLAEDSVGPATLANIDHYYETTEKALKHYSGFGDITVNLELETSSWKPDMLTRMVAKCGNLDMNRLFIRLQKRLAQVRRYVPGYHIIGTPNIKNGELEILVSVTGQGDWIPSHAGNLDIINCAAIRVAENFALEKHRSNDLVTGSTATDMLIA